MKLLNVLLIGSGGRESAMLPQILSSPLLQMCYFAPGVPQIFTHEKLVSTEIDVNSNSDILKFCKGQNIDFIICGPEVPLCNGVVDELALHGIVCFGPNKMAAELENSKIFMKDVLSKANVPTAKYRTFSAGQEKQAFKFLSSLQGKIVIKTDGLAAGKGVVICENVQDAEKVLREFFSGRFGSAGKRVVIEEFLEGREVSVFAICDGKQAIPFFHACDYKKVHDGDAGPNTGGMGSFAPSFLSDSEFREIVNRYFVATLAELENRGISYRGFLFGGLIITNEGPKFLEYNIRMGDPETQSIMPLLVCDLLEILIKASKKELVASDIKFKSGYAVTVVMASGGYPGEFTKGHEITGINDISCTVFPGGIQKKEDKFVTNGGRVLCVTAVAESKAEARQKVYENVKKIRFEGMHFRSDIGK